MALGYSEDALIPLSQRALLLPDDKDAAKIVLEAEAQALTAQAGYQSFLGEGFKALQAKNYSGAATGFEEARKRAPSFLKANVAIQYREDALKKSKSGTAK